MTKKVIDSRVPVDTDVAPVSLKEEHHAEADNLTELSDQLTQVRAELGRLLQITHNLVATANRVEKDMTEARKELMSKYDISDGKWVLDSANKQLVRLADNAPLVP